MAIFLLVVSPLCDNDTIRSVLNEIDDVMSWRKEMQHCFFLKSDKSAVYLQNKIREKITAYRFFITEVSSDNRAGYMTAGSWAYLKVSGVLYEIDSSNPFSL